MSRKFSSLAEKLEAYSDRSGDCWIWTRSRNRYGYGYVYVGDPAVVLRLAHRVAYQVYVGEIPPGMEVCHDCPGGDNPACINPAHLFLATHHENITDAAHKQRMQHGSRHYKAKLTEADIPVIRARVAAGETQAVVAADYGVSAPIISYVINRITWKHVK